VSPRCQRRALITCRALRVGRYVRRIPLMSERVLIDIVRRQRCIDLDWRCIVMVMCEGITIEGREIFEDWTKEISELFSVVFYSIVRFHCTTKVRAAPTLDIKDQAQKYLIMTQIKPQETGKSVGE
jgi:hypothetical protein